MVGAAAMASTYAAAEDLPRSLGGLVLNDDGHVFLYLNDDLGPADSRRYLESYCRPGVGTIAFCVGDMSWPTFHPTKVGVHYKDMPPPPDLKSARARKNLDNFSGDPGGFFGTVFGSLRALGKTALASYRMNDAHFTAPDNPNVSEFWKRHAEFTLGPAYGYYGGCLNYEHDAVRGHFFERVMEFAALYPDVDGFELDAMRSPYFFPPDKGKSCAPLMTELVKRIKSALDAQATRLGRARYLLTVNVPATPELALESGLDVASWDVERLFDLVSIGTYQANMDLPLPLWKATVHNTPVYSYINCSAQTGRYFGLEEYRAAATNAYGAGADGIYLFNYPCLLELAGQTLVPATEARFTLPDLRSVGQPDLSKAPTALDELGDRTRLEGKTKRYLFCANNESGYRHFAPPFPSFERSTENPNVQATFRCYEPFASARSLLLQFKIVNVTRTETFEAVLNGQSLSGNARIDYASNGRDTRTHTVELGPYQIYTVDLRPEQLQQENVLIVSPTRLEPHLSGPVRLAEIELLAGYDQ